MTPSRRATPSALGWARPLGLGASLALLLAGCATPDPTHDSALRAYDRAAAMGLATERLERPYARITDGAPWSRERRVEVSR